MKRLIVKGFLAIACQWPGLAWAEPKVWQPVIEIEEDVYTYTAANNGAGPMWCAGSTSVVRLNDRVFLTALEALPDAKPLNNCRWVLYERRSNGWQVLHRGQGRTREPAPMATFDNGSVMVSGNPTLAKSPEPNGGPAKPEIWHFDMSRSEPIPKRWLPSWQGQPRFSEHSYRSFAADGARGDLILFQNIGYAHAEWTYRDPDGKWRANGRLQWPWGDFYEKAKPVRLCYPNVALDDGAVHFFGVEDVTEPVEAWRLHKKNVSGREWDYVFRRLYYTWTPDITANPFHEWIEIADLSKTAGHVWPCDLWVASSGEVHLLWSERAIDERLREPFFPTAQQAYRLCYAVLKEGAIVRRHTLFQSREQQPGPVVQRARFHAAPNNRLYVVSYVTSIPESGNRLTELDLETGEMVRETLLPFKAPFTHFFTATPRAGCKPSTYLDLLGTRQGVPMTMSYARVSW